MKLKKENFIKNKHYYIARFLDALAFPFACLFKYRDKSASFVDPEKILLIGKHHAGDLLFITPLLAALRSKYTGANIYVTCPENFRDILKNNPNVDGFIDFGESASGILVRFVEVLKVLIRIRREGFDLGISYNNNQFAINHLMLFLSGIDRRIGYGHKGLSFLLTGVVDFEGPKVIVEERLDFARHLGVKVEFAGTEIFLTDTEIEEAEAILSNLELKPDLPVIGISPHAEHLFLWNSSDWADLCRKIRAEYNAEILFIGSNAAAGIIEDIRKGLDFRTHTLAGKTTIRQAAGVIRRLDLLVSIDTGTRHMAAAEETPVIFLRHGSDYDVELGPYGSYHFMVSNKVPCAPCGDSICRFGTYACVKGITAESVLDMVKDNTGAWMTTIRS